MHQLSYPEPEADPLAEALPPLSEQEALVESQRCLYCYDAPCTHACPTHIDIPRFIKKIATGNMLGSGKTILSSNLLGATCARVCPVQELCEGACVLGAEHNPIMIGRLQRHSMDWIENQSVDLFAPGAASGKTVAVIGSGPAGLSCAGELAKLGHAVTVFDKRDLAGGLSTYGIIALREPVTVALREVEMVKRMGVTFESGVELCRDIKLADLRAKYDAVFLAGGLGSTPQLNIPGEEYIVDGLDYIEGSKLGRAELEIGTEVAVIGAGNTAIDCATIAKRLGAQRVTILYRGLEQGMSAYRHEVDFARTEGIAFRFQTQPARIVVEEGKVTGVVCVFTGQPTDADSEFTIPANQVVKAIGQQKPALAVLLGLAAMGKHIEVDAEMETSLAGVYAGGDSIRSTGTCSTVMAVQDGKLAAAAIHRKLLNG